MNTVEPGEPAGVSFQITGNALNLALNIPRGATDAPEGGGAAGKVVSDFSRPGSRFQEDSCACERCTD